MWPTKIPQLGYPPFSIQHAYKCKNSKVEIRNNTKLNQVRYDHDN